MVNPRPFVPPLPSDAIGTRHWSPSSLEARLLAGSLRSVPVTLLHGSEAADREGLLTLGLMPLLGRRREDRAAPTRGARVLPFPDRRGALGRGAAPAELVLSIDDWPAPPLQPLAAQIEHARVSSAADDPGSADVMPGRVLLVMKNFEAALDAAAAAIHPDRFWLELAEALRTPLHGVHLLLMTQEAVTPGLRWLDRLVPELGSQGLLLQPGVAPELAAVPGLSGPGDAAMEPASTVPPISDQEWLDAVQGAADRAASRGSAPKPPGAATSATPGPASPTPAPLPARPVAATAAADVPTQKPARPTLAASSGERAAAARKSAPALVTWPEPATRTAPSLGTAAARLLAAAPLPTVAAAVPPVAAVSFTGPHSAIVAKGRHRAPMGVLLPVLGAALFAASGAWWWSHTALEPAPAAVALSSAAATRSIAAMDVQQRSGDAGTPASASVVSTRQPNLAIAPTAPLVAVVAPPAPAAPPAPTPLPAPIAALPAAAAPVVPTSMPTSSDPGADLRHLLAGLPLLDLRGPPAQMAARLSATPQPTLALVRYDALQKLPATAAFASVRVVAPLFVEPLQVWVRADTPQRRLEALARGVIDVGRNDGDGATAAGATEALFGKPLPAARQRRLPDDQALAALQRGEVDAVLRVQASPLTALASASVAKGGLQTLTLDRASPAGARALRAYLPAPSAVAGGSAPTGEGTLGVMSFLVVQGGDDAARQRLAGDAMRALCTGLSALRAAASPAWAAVRPDVQLPAGRPYVLAAEATGEQNASCGAGAAKRLDLTSNSPTPKGSLQ